MSLRARLLLGMALVAVVLVGAAVLVTRTTERHLVAQIDAQLRESPWSRQPLREIFRGGAIPPGDDGGGIGLTQAPSGPAAVNSFYVALVSPAGDVQVVRVPNARDEDPPLPVLDAQQAFDHDHGSAYTVASAGDLRYRVLAQPLGGAGGSILVTALPLGDVDAAIDRLVAVEVAATVAILAALGLVTFWVLRLGVRPVKQMTATATAIAAGDLSHRVPDVAAGTEAGELGQALNKMLGSIEEAFDERARSQDRLRQFVADASHELRTPVATVRGYAELHRVGGLRQPEQLDDAMSRIEQEARRMGTLVDDLLLLARLDQGRPLERDPVDLATVVGDAARDARAMAPDRTVTVELPAGRSVVVLGDDHRLRQVVANLVGNALVHTPPEASLSLSAGVQGDRAVVEVSDTGPGMAPEAAARAFERFFRADPSRARHRGGSGLGLSIVQASVEAQGGTVVLRTAPGEGTTVRVELPLAGVEEDEERPTAALPPPPPQGAMGVAPWAAPPG